MTMVGKRGKGRRNRKPVARRDEAAHALAHPLFRRRVRESAKVYRRKGRHAEKDVTRD